MEEALRLLIEKEETISFDAVEKAVASGAQGSTVTDVEIDPVELGEYDDLFFQSLDEELEEALG